MKKKGSMTSSLRSSKQRPQQQSLKSNKSRGMSASSLGSSHHQNRQLVYDSQDDYLDNSYQNNENANHNTGQLKRLQTSSSKKIQNSSIQQLSGGSTQKMRISSKKSKNRSGDANMAHIFLNNKESSSGMLAAQDWNDTSEKKQIVALLGKQQHENSVKSLQRMLSKQSSLANSKTQGQYGGPISNSKSATALPTQQDQEQQMPYEDATEKRGSAKQLQKAAAEHGKLPLQKQSSLKKFDQRLYQHSYTKVFVMGDTKFGQLGFLNPNDKNSSLGAEQRASPIIAVPKLCSYNILVKQIACGEAHSHILSQDGYVYSMGSNQYGVLGLGKGDDILQTVTQPQLVPNLQCIVDIASGRAHTVALDVHREVFGWGRSDSGAIGLRMATPQHQSHPMPLAINIDANDQVVQVDCGLEHTCFLTSDGHVFACGEGEYGQLGLGYVTMKEYRPMRVRIKDVKPGDYVTKVACGAHHTAFLTRFKSVYTTGANNLGQLGLDSLEHQVNSPTLVSALEDKYITEINCGEGSFAISAKGDLYVWGLYNLELYRKPFMPQALSRPVAQVSQSFYGVTAAVDLDEQAWYWHSQLEVDTQNAMKLPAYPTVIKQMKRRLVKKVVAGKDLVFALGDDVNNNQSSSTVKDSQATSNTGLQEIPERDERPGSSTLTSHQQQKMPSLDLGRIHRGSTNSLKQVMAPPKSNGSSKKASKSRSATRSRQSRSASRSRSRSRQGMANQEVRRHSNSAVKIRMTKSRSPKSSTMRPRGQQHQQRQSSQKSCKRRSASASRTNSEAKHNRRRAVSRSRGSSAGPMSRSSAAAPRTRSNSQPKVRTHASSKVVAFQQDKQSLQSTKQSSKVNNVKVTKKRQNLERQVEKRFQDLTMRLETQKEEVVTRLSKLTQKVNKITKATSVPKLKKKQHTKSSKSVKNNILLNLNEANCLSQLLQKRQLNQDPLSDYNYASQGSRSQERVDLNQHQVQQQLLFGASDQPQCQAEINVNSQCSAIAEDPRQALTIFNAELQDELNMESRPTLVYSPKADTVDIRSPTGHHHRQHQQQREQPQQRPEQLRVHVSDSPPQARYHNNRELQSQDQRRQQTRPQMMENLMRESAPFRVKSPGNVRSSGVRSPTNNVTVVKSPTQGCLRQRSGGVRSPKQQVSYDQQLIMQLREQIDYLERQNARLKDEKIQDQVKMSEIQNRYDEARQANLKSDVGLDAHLRSLESQLRTAKLEKSDLAIKHADAERRVRDLENKVINLQMAKNKEEDYLNKLGKSHDSLRQEKNKTRDLGSQNDMLHKTISILETTIAQVKKDKDVIMEENIRLKDYIEAKDIEAQEIAAQKIEADVDDSRNHLDQQVAEGLGHESTENMDRRSRSLVLHSTTYPASSMKKPEHAKHGSNSSMLDRTVERSNSRNGALKNNRRTGSQLSNYSQDLYNLFQPAPIDPEEAKLGIVVGGGIAEYQNLPSEEQQQQMPVEQEHNFQSAQPSQTPYRSDNKIVSSQFDTKESKETGFFASNEPPTVDRIRQPNHQVPQATLPAQSQVSPELSACRRQERLKKDDQLPGKFDQSNIAASLSSSLYNHNAQVPPQQPVPVSQEDDSTRDPRIQRLLEDAHVLQENHRLLMSSQSPLRIKDRSADRLSNNSLSRPSSSLQHQQQQQEITERAKSLNYTTRPIEQTTQQMRGSTPAIQEHQSSSQSPLRLRSPSRNSPSPSSGGIRPYPCEPPSQSDQNTTPKPSGYPTTQHTIREQPIEDDDDDNEDDNDDYIPEMLAPVRDDFDPDEIRRRAGISPNNLLRQSFPTTAQTDRHPDPSTSNFKDLLKDAQRPVNPSSQTFDDRNDQKSAPSEKPRSLHNPRPRHDNSDYYPSQFTRDEDSRGSRSRSPKAKRHNPILDEKDKEKIADAYNQKLLDNIERLAEKAKKRPAEEEQQPRVNKFKRNKSGPPSLKDNSLPASHNSPSPVRNSGLPSAIFPAADNQAAYQDKLRQLRQGTSPNDQNQQPRAASNGSNKRNNSKRRPPTKEEDDFETQQMLNKPGTTAKKPTWTTGLQDTSAEKEKPTAENNSFLARREALQNRLKKI